MHTERSDLDGTRTRTLMPTTDNATIISVRSPEFDSARAQIEQALDADHTGEALQRLEAIVESEDVSPPIDDELWVYRTLAELYLQRDRFEDALDAYRRAFRLDPRDRDILQSLTSLLFDVDAELDGETDLLEAILVHARASLDTSMLARIHRRLGARYVEADDSDQASAHLRRAAQCVDSDREAMQALLQSWRVTGDPFDALETREQLIEAFDDPEASAEAYVELGDEWRERFDRGRKALELYERAADFAPTDEVWEHIRTTAESLDDADESLYRAHLTLAERADGDEARAEHFTAAATVARDELWSPERARRALERALEIEPDRFEAFQSLVSMLEDAEDWSRLERAYRHVIDLNRQRQSPDDDLLAILWYQLGEVYRRYLDQPRDAIEVYREASTLFPDNPKFHEAIVNLVESTHTDAEVAEQHLRALYRIDASRTDVLKRLGRLYLRRESLDPALCHFRAYEALGGSLDDQEASLVERFETGMYRSPDRTLDEELRREKLYPDDLDPDVSEVFRLLFPVLFEWTSEFRSEYGLDRTDAIDLDEPLAFNNTYRDIAETLARDDIPPLWQNSEYRGLNKAALDSPSVIAGDDLFESGDEKRIAFATARVLFLLEPPFYWLGLRDVSELRAFFWLALQMVRPDVELERDEAMEDAYRLMKRKLDDDHRDRLRDAIERATDDADDVELLSWVEAVEDAADRVGLLFADDLNVARMHLQTETDTFSGRDIETRMRNLAEYSVSDDYLALREALGMAVSS